MGVGRIMPQARAQRVVEGEKTRPHGQNGPQPRGERDARIIKMAVIGGPAIDRKITGIMRISPPSRHPRLIGGVVIAPRVVGIGLIGEGGGEEDHRRTSHTPRRQDIKRQPILTSRAGQMQRIGATAQPLGHNKFEIGLPTAITQIIGVEMNGAVIGRRMPPAHFSTAPGRAGHGTGGRIDQHAMAGLGADIGNILGADVARKIPGGQNSRGRARPCGAKTCMQRRRLYSPGEMDTGAGDITRGDQQLPGPIGQHEAGMAGLGQAGLPARDALLAQQDLARRRVSAQPQAHPLPQRPGMAGGQKQCCLAHPNFSPSAIRPDTHGDGRTRLFLAQHRSGIARHRLQHHQRRPAARPRRATRRIGHNRIGARPDRLVPPRKAMLENAR